MLILSFFMATGALLLQGVLPPRLAILAYSPWIALVALRCSQSRALWLSAAAGALIDLLSNDPMGLHALNYTLSTALIYRFRKHFLHDQPLHLSIFTALFSLLSTALHLSLLFLYDQKVPFGGKWIVADLIGMPLIDALYAFVWFAAPLTLFEKIRAFYILFRLKRKNSTA